MDITLHRHLQSSFVTTSTVKISIHKSNWIVYSLTYTMSLNSSKRWFANELNMYAHRSPLITEELATLPPFLKAKLDITQEVIWPASMHQGETKKHQHEKDKKKKRPVDWERTWGKREVEGKEEKKNKDVERTSAEQKRREGERRMKIKGVVLSLKK